LTKKQQQELFDRLDKYADCFSDVPGLTTRVEHTVDLTGKRVPQNLASVWTEKHTEVLESLKIDLIQACNLPLHIVRFDRPFHVSVDASAYAVAGLIEQCDDDGDKYPLAFFSTKLTDSQKNWSTIEREAFAVLVAINKYRNWFFGNKIILYSDHNPLTFLTASAPKSSKLMRWSLALAEFDIEFRFRPGKHNVPADTLSRL